MIYDGSYIVFEGMDGSGKSTIMKLVSEALPSTLGYNIPIDITHQPGSTPLGVHIRQLVKYPETFNQDITIDNLSRQLLYMVDNISFIKQRLVPQLSKGVNVFSDRSSFISALVYGMAEGLSLADIDRLFQLITPPMIDRLYVLNCPWQVSKERTKNRGSLDHFDRKPNDFFQKLSKTYGGLVTTSQELTLLISKIVSPRDIVYVDATLTPEVITKIIVDDLVKYLNSKSF